MTQNVTYTRPEYLKALPDWTKVRDAVDGETTIKGKRTLYLPRPNPADKSEAANKRYDQYLERALYVNATGRTLSGLIGIALRKPPDMDVPDSLEPLRTDTDGSGGGINNQVHRTLEDVMETARHGLLADFPTRNAALSRAEQIQGNIHATITSYAAEKIINWSIGEDGKLDLVVLLESVPNPNTEEMFAPDDIPQWRELRLGILSTEEPGTEARYVVRIWRKSNDKDGNPEIATDKNGDLMEYVPLDGSGKPWKEIPFTFVGATDNNSEIDIAPLLDLACVNFAHYRNSADYEESVFFVGQPTFAFTGLDESWVKLMRNEGVYIGSRAAIPLPVGGDAKMLQASPNTLAGEAMVKKEKQMVALGARLMISGEVAKTADQNRSDVAAAYSVLSLVVENVQNAYELALSWCATFMKANPEDVSFEMNADFIGLNLDPNLLNALISGWQKGGLPDEDYVAAMKAIGLIDPDKPFETVIEEMESSGAGGNIPALPLDQGEE